MFDTNRTCKGAVLFFTAMIQRGVWWVKFGVLTIFGLSVAGIRWIWLTKQQAAEWVINGSYWFCLALIGWGGAIAWRAWQRRGGRVAFHRRQALMLLPIAGLAAVLHVHEPHMLKVNYDEHVLMGISRSMHFEHKAAWPGGAQAYSGTVTPTSLLADKRPVFFPFLLSLLHTTTGYRLENVFVLNGILAAGLLVGLYVIGRRYQSSLTGILFALLLTGVPLVAQNATGGGFDLLNVTLIAWLAVSICRYFESPTGARLEAAVFLSLCLANTRYESVLYTIAPAAAFLCAWWRSRSLPALPWSIAFTPLAVLPSLLSNSVFSSSDTFLQSQGEPFWAFGYLPHNISHAVFYLFNTDRGGTNSVWLASLGVFALVGTVVVVLRMDRLKFAFPPETRALMVVGGAVGVDLLVKLGLWWGEWDDPMAARFTLPYWLLFGWAVLEVGRHLEVEHGWRVFKPLTYVSLAVLLLFSLPDASSARQTNRMKGSVALDWSIDYLKKHYPVHSTFVLAHSAIPYINAGYAAIPLDRAKTQLGKNAAMLHYGMYSDVLLILDERRVSPGGRWAYESKVNDLVACAEVEFLARATPDPFYRMTIYKVVKFDDAIAVPPWPANSQDKESYRKRVYGLLP